MDHSKSIHGWRPEFSAEWWYFTGIGEIDGVGPANFHVAFFRKHSRTFKRHFWFAHYGVCARNVRFWFWREYKIDGSGPNILGCRVGKWEFCALGGSMTVMANNGDTLMFLPKKPPVWHDDNYYSITDLDVQGRVLGREFNGHGWFDHSTFDASVQELLDLKYTWIALQLDNGTEIMVQWSSRDPKFLGTMVSPGGKDCKLPQRCLLVERDGGWILSLPRNDIELRLEKVVENRIPGNPEPGYTEGILHFPGGRGYFEIAEGNTKSLLRKST